MQFVRSVYQGVVDTIWNNTIKDNEVVMEDTATTQRRVVETIKSHFERLEQKKVPIKEFEYTRSLSVHPLEYKNVNTPHVQTALQEMAAADAGLLATRPQVGDRISFVIQHRPRKFLDPKKFKVAERALSTRLFNPAKHLLDREKAVMDAMNPLRQLCQAVGIDPTQLVHATAQRVRREDNGLSTAFGQQGGVHIVPMRRCMLAPSPVKRRPRQPVMDAMAFCGGGGGGGKPDDRTVIKASIKKNPHKAAAKKKKKKRKKIVEKPKPITSFFSKL